MRTVIQLCESKFEFTFIAYDEYTLYKSITLVIELSDLHPPATVGEAALRCGAHHGVSRPDDATVLRPQTYEDVQRAFTTPITPVFF